MNKLSRTTRYKDLRDQLDEETTKAQIAPEQPINLTRSSRNNQAAHASDYYSYSETITRIQNQKTSPTDVLDELLGEVKQYNIDRGQRVIADTKYNILEALSEEEPGLRERHLEPMEPNDNPGGTTMNIEGIDITMIDSRPPAQKKPEKKPVPQPTPSVELQVFDLGAEDFDRTIRQSTPKPVKKEKVKRKERTERVPSSTQTIAVRDEPEKASTDSSSFSWTSVLLTIMILIVLVSLGFTVYMILQAGIL